MGLYLGMIAVGLLGCGDGPSTTSVPVDPTIDFEVEAPEEPQMLVGFFTSGKLAYPEALGGLKLGMNEAEALPLLTQIRDPRVRDPGVQTVANFRIIGASLKGWEVAGISLIFESDTAVLDQIDISLPEGQALSALTTAFGAETDATQDAQGHKVYVWSDSEVGLRIELSDAGEGRSICKYRKPLE